MGAGEGDVNRDEMVRSIADFSDVTHCKLGWRGLASTKFLGEEAIPVQTLAAAILAAPFSEDGWDKALRSLANATGSSRAHLIALNHRHARLNWLTDAPPGYGQLFLDIEAYRPEVNYRIAAIAPPMKVAFEHDYAIARQRTGTNEIYLDHARELEAEFGCQAVLMQSDQSMIGLAMLHGQSDGETTIEQRDVFGAALPHMMAAVRLQNAMDHQGAELLRGSLETMRTAAVLIDGAGRVCARTERAEKVLSGGLFAIVDGRLHAAHAAFDGRFQKALGGALAMQPMPAQDLWVPQASPPMLVEINALPIRPWSLSFAPAAIITFRSPVRGDLLDGALLAEALGLTRAEGDVAAMVAMGHSRKAIAEARLTSVQTVTAQLRSIFQKCGVRREAELVSIALQVGQLARNSREN